MAKVRSKTRMASARRSRFENMSTRCPAAACSISARTVSAFAGIIIVNVGNPESCLRGAKRKRNGIPRPYVVLVAERLADDDRVRITQLSQNLIGSAPGEKIGARIAAERLRIDGCQRGGHALIADFVGAQTIDGRDARQLLDFLSQFQRDRGMAVCSGEARGAKIEISGQPIAHPEQYGLAKAPDHDAD